MVCSSTNGKRVIEIHLKNFFSNSINYAIIFLVNKSLKRLLSALIAL